MDKIVHYLKWGDLQKTLKAKGVGVFSLADFSHIFGLSPETARRALSRQVKTGRLIRIKRGLYSAEETRPNLYLLANKIYQPSYISLETALSFYRLIPETVYGVTSLTTKVTREFTAFGTSFTYQTIKKEGFTGYQPLNMEGQTVYIATPEKALADFLYFVALGKRALNDRLILKSINRPKLDEFLGVLGAGHKDLRPLLEKIPKQEILR